jgi:hypothetical protein
VRAMSLPGPSRQAAFFRPTVGAKHSPQAFPLADLGRLAAYQGEGPLGQLVQRRLHLDTSPEEMADGDPQMAACL